jgi:hypothetical protein
MKTLPQTSKIGGVFLAHAGYEKCKQNSDWEV